MTLAQFKSEECLTALPVHQSDSDVEDWYLKRQSKGMSLDEVWTVEEVRDRVNKGQEPRCGISHGSDESISVYVSLPVEQNRWHETSNAAPWMQNQIYQDALSLAVASLSDIEPEPGEGFLKARRG